MKYASFLATSYLTFTNELCQLWSYWTEFHEIFTQYTDIIYAVNAPIEVAISCSISECQSNESGKFAISVQQILRYLFSYLLLNHDTTIHYINVQCKFDLSSCFTRKLLDRSSPKFYTTRYQFAFIFVTLFGCHGNVP